MALTKVLIVKHRSVSRFGFDLLENIYILGQLVQTNFHKNENSGLLYCGHIHIYFMQLPWSELTCEVIVTHST